MGTCKGLNSNDRDILIGDARETIRGLADVYGYQLPTGMVSGIAETVIDQIAQFFEEVIHENHVLRRTAAGGNGTHSVPPLRAGS